MNKANKITVFRLILSFLLIIFLTFPFYSIGLNLPKILFFNIIIEVKYIIAAIIFAFASFTDFLDGYVARKYNMVTDTGKTLDAIADKVLVNSILIILAVDGMISVWVPVIIVVRDIIVDVLKMEVGRKDQVVAAIKTGKIKTALLMIGIFFTLIYNLPFELLKINLALMLVYFGTIMSIVSLVEYFNMSKKFIFKKGEM